MANDYAAVKRQTNATVGVYAATLDQLASTLPEGGGGWLAALRRRTLLEAEERFLSVLHGTENFLNKYSCDPEDGDYDV